MGQAGAGGLNAPNLLGQGQGMGMGMGGAVPPSPWGAAPSVGGNQSMPGGLDFSRLFAPGKCCTVDAARTYISYNTRILLLDYSFPYCSWFLLISYYYY